jgi:hypothetical protein
MLAAGADRAGAVDAALSVALREGRLSAVDLDDADLRGGGSRGASS